MALPLLFLVFILLSSISCMAQMQQQPMGPPQQFGQAMGPPQQFGQAMGPPQQFGQAMGSPPPQFGQPMGPPGAEQSVKAVKPEALGLSLDFYTRTCPRLEQIVQDIVIDKQQKQTATAAGTLRLFFHDCMVEGCDASILINSNHLNKAEKDSDMNDSLSGDAFDVVGRIKNALELTCPGTVSCADILALATRNLVKMMGGPYYKVHLGRRDGTVSMASNVEANLARATDPMEKILTKLGGKGFSPEEVVALVGGGHTIGFAHCKEFIDRMKSYTKVSPTDPGVNPGFAERMKQMCANYPADTTMSCFLDPNTPGVFDNVFFKNLYWGMGLLPSDHALVIDSRTEPFVKRFADNDTAFFEAFSKAMEKVGTVGVKTGSNGEIRHRCDVINHFKM